MFPHDPSADPLDSQLQVFGLDTPEQVEEDRDRPGPSCLVAGAEPRPVVAVEVFMEEDAEMSYLAVWYDRIDERAVLDTLSPKARRRAERFMDKAHAKNHMHVLKKLTEEVDGEHRLIEELPLIVRETHTEIGTPFNAALDSLLRPYLASLPYDRRRLLARYRIVDVARKVVGVGSVGTECWVILLQGVDDDDPLFLQLKQAQPSVLAPYVDFKLPFDNQVQRVVVGQCMIQGSPDIFLGWGEVERALLPQHQGGVCLDPAVPQLRRGAARDRALDPLVQRRPTASGARLSQPGPVSGSRTHRVA